jgi:hypothetical protein
LYKALAEAGDPRAAWIIGVTYSIKYVSDRKEGENFIYLSFDVFSSKNFFYTKLYPKYSPVLEKVPDPKAVAPYTLKNQCCRIRDPVPF